MTSEFTRPLSTLLSSMESLFTERPTFNGAHAMKGRDNSDKDKHMTRGDSLGSHLQIYDPNVFNTPIYCITTRFESPNRQRIMQRFQLVGIHYKLHYVNAIEEDMPIVSNYDNSGRYSKEVARYASHIKALRLFLENREDNYCIICEDDVLFTEKFIQDMNSLIHNCPKDTPLIALCWFVTGGIEQCYVGKNMDNRNLWKVDPEYTHGASAYYISRDYALRCIDAFDRSHDTLKKSMCIPQITADLFIRRSNGYMASMPILICDCIEKPDQCRYFCRWDYDLYAQSDVHKLSPLAKMKPSQSWMNYPYLKAFHA